MPRTRSYPQLNLIKDIPAQQSLRLLWDRFYDLLDEVDTVNTEVVAARTREILLAARVEEIDLKVEINDPGAGVVTDDTGFGFPGGGGPGGGGPGGGGGPVETPGNDNGLGQAGLNSAGPTGHLNPPIAPTAFSVGQIVGGVGNEFPTLLAPAANQPARAANLVTLLGRLIWHLQRNGFNAGKQRNPSQAISGDKLTVQVNGIWTAYDVFPGAAQDAFTNQWNMQMAQTYPANNVVDGGIPD